MIRPIAHSPRKKLQPQDHRQEERLSRGNADDRIETPPVMKRRCPACKRVFECSDVVKDVVCADCLAMAMM